MCVASMIGDHYRDKWIQPGGPVFYPTGSPPSFVTLPSPISREEFEALKRDVAEMKILLQRAIKYDEANGEPECEIDEKMDLLRKVADLVGIDISDVLERRPR